MLDQTLAIVLAGEPGSRLHPLTAHRAKAAIPFGGKYRVIDFTLTNCLHSGIRRALVLTQYKSHSLQKHLRDGWSIFNPELGEFITPVPPQMRTSADWYRGTADAVFQNIYLLERNEADYVLVLSGDQIYRMDYAALLKSHRQHGGIATIATIEMDAEDARGHVGVSVEQDGRISRLEEHPDESDGTHLVSTGVCVFDKAALIDAVRADSGNSASFHDLARDILPTLLDQGVYAYSFGGSSGRVSQDRFWCELRDLDDYYKANLDLLEPVPPLDLYQPDWTIRSYQSQHPPARTVPGDSGNEGVIVNSVLAGGVIIAGGAVDHSVLFSRVTVADEAVVKDAILCDGVQIGEHANLQNCVIDKNVRVPPGTEIGMDRDADKKRFHVTPGGVVVIPKGYEF